MGIDYFNSIFKREAVSDLEADLLKLLGTYTEACKVNNINIFALFPYPFMLNGIFKIFRY